MRCPSPNLSLSSYKIKIKEQRKIYVYKWEKLYCCSINWIATGIYIKHVIHNTWFGWNVMLQFLQKLVGQDTCVKPLWPASSNFFTYFSQRDTNYTKKKSIDDYDINTRQVLYLCCVKVYPYNWRFLRFVNNTYTVKKTLRYF